MDYKPTLLTAAGLNSACPYALAEELEWISRLGRTLRNKDEAVMVGAGPGVFALALLEGRSNMRREAPYLHVVEIGTFQWIQAHLEASDCDLDRVQFVQGDSKLVGREWQSEIDFLLVDGDHTYEGVAADISAWVPHVKRRSYIFFHDYLERDGGMDGVGAWHEGGCARAVCEAIAAGNLMMPVVHVGISIVCEKL